MGRHAYLIIAHNKWNNLQTLVELLDDDRNDIFIHIDKKGCFSNEQIITIQENARKSSIIFIDRISVSWGAYSLIDATLKLLAAATKRGNYLYYHLLSGSDLPIKHQDYIHDYFDENQGKEFIHIGDREWNLKTKDRAQYYWMFQEIAGNSRQCYCRILRALDRLSVKIQKHLGIDRLRTLQFASGSEWFSITDEFARYVLSKRSLINTQFRYCICADECFIQTLAVNSHYKNKVFNTNNTEKHNRALRYIRWNHGKAEILSCNDFNGLSNTECLFARKFDEDIDKDIIKYVAKRIIQSDESIAF